LQLNTSEPQQDLADAYKASCASIIAMLQATKGQWRRVAASSGVPYDTLWKIAEGRIANPTVDTLQKLIDYFAPPPRRRRRKARIDQ
jgi:hypothetical protein